VTRVGESAVELRSRQRARRLRSVWESFGRSPSFVELVLIVVLAVGLGSWTLRRPRFMAVSTRVRAVPGLSSWMVVGTVNCSSLAFRGS
jgi:hypothetical protein